MSNSRSYPIHMVDVFAEARLAGNQLAVVEDAATLTDAEMQAIARETNFSETTFVLAHEGDRATVRIFTPGFELPFAGHPTLGTAWALTEGQRPITLELPVGPVEVVFEAGIAWMTPPAVSFLEPMAAEDAAALLGLESTRLSARWPIECATVGPTFLLVPLADLDALRSIRLNNALFARHQDTAAFSVFAFTDEAYGPDADFAARMFFDAGGVREDPATGSANTAFAAYLEKHRGALGRVVVDQGVEMLRPSRLYLDVGDPLRVGGRVVPVIRGELSV